LVLIVVFSQINLPKTGRLAENDGLITVETLPRIFMHIFLLSVMILLKQVVLEAVEFDTSHTVK